MVPYDETVMPLAGGLLCGLFGYAGIDVHMRWRETPEHAQVIEAFVAMSGKGLSLEVAALPGVDVETGWFHVRFRSDI